MNLQPEDFSFELELTSPKRQFPQAVCPRCAAVQQEAILADDYSAYNLVCASCQYRFCSYCNKCIHTLVKCNSAKKSKSRREECRLRDSNNT